MKSDTTIGQCVQVHRLQRTPVYIYGLLACGFGSKPLGVPRWGAVSSLLRIWAFVSLWAMLRCVVRVFSVVTFALSCVSSVRIYLYRPCACCVVTVLSCFQFCNQLFGSSISEVGGVLAPPSIFHHEIAATRCHHISKTEEL